MKRKSFITLLVCTLFVAVLALSLGLSFDKTVANADDKEVSIRIAHISDLHFYPEELSNSKSVHYQAKVNSENKFVGESGGSLRKTFESMVGTEGNIKDDAPMIILASGDLTLNGEKEGHYYLAKLFSEITEMVRKDERYANFQILVIPGNHDMYNPNAMRYYPTEEELDACATPEEREELLINYKKQAPTCDNQEFIDLYWSFGYAPQGLVNPRTGEVSQLASNMTLEFFYDSEYWYEDDYGLTTVHPPVEIVEKCEETKDYSLVNPYVRHGACSYIARTNEITVVSVDANSREYIGTTPTKEGEELLPATSADWEETTSGDVEDRLLRWITTSIKEDVASDRLIVGQLHHNVVPHFGMEGDIFSMFTYDDYKKVAPILADAGLKYVFTGHMHASDIAYDVSQSGNVIYDMETGTTIGLGAAYRIIDLKSKGSGANYTEDVYTQVINLDTNFDYFTADSLEVKHFEGGHFAYFGDKMKNMVTNIVGSYVNDGLYAKLTDLASGKVSGFSKFLGGILTDLVDSLSEFDLYPIVVENNKISLGKETKEGYDLISYANDLVDYIMTLDLSFGTVEGGYRLSEVIYDVYGGHLLGTNPQEIPQNLRAFFAKLEDGTFVKGLVDLVQNAVVPQLDLILNAPIRYNLSTPTLADSGVNGFDISESYNMKLGFLSIDSIIKSLLDTHAFGKQNAGGKIEERYDDENGYISLKMMLKAISENAPNLINNLLAPDSLIEPLIREYNIKELYDEYFGRVIGYLNKYFASDLSSVIKTELIDKYVTKALCVNLGIYAKDIVESVAVDPSYDGGYFDKDGNLVNELVHLQYSHNGAVQYAEHSYSKNAVDIAPTAENGLLPAQVSISNVVENGEISPSQMKLRWTTHITLDIFEYSVPESYIVFAKTKEGLKTANKVKASGENVNWEYPTIDLGIHYLNLTYVYDTFNLYNVKLNGLDADTTYYYMVGNDTTGWTDVRSFKTAKSSDAESYTIMGITDIQGSIEKNYTDALPNLQIAKDKVNADMVISLGDNVDNGKSIYQYYWMLEGQKDFWSYLPFVGVPGNHEDGENELSTHVNLPNEETGKEYYSFIYVNTLYVMLNTNDLTENGELSVAQTEWLVNTLKNAEQNAKVKWIVVGMHKGLYTAGSHAYDNDVIAMRAQLTPIFARYGVDLVLQGHDHTYSVTSPLNGEGKNANATVDKNGSFVKEGGVIYINLGTMGDKFYDYLYSEAIGDNVFVKRNGVSKELEKYLTADKYLELKETPVFMDLTVSDNELAVKTYTIIDGKTVEVDNIVITDSPVIGNQSLTVAQIVLICVSVCVFIAIVVLVVLILRRKTSNQQ